MRNLSNAALASLLCMTSIHANEPLIVAHRGASGHAPENTLPAFRLAWAQGADAIEGDFYQTRDGHIVCIHDKDTERVAGRKLAVQQSSLVELRKLDVGAYRGETFRGTIIPTIAEVFAVVPEGKRIYIEVKDDESMVPALLGEIEESGLQRSQIVVISFNAEVIRAIKTKAPGFKAYWLSGFKKEKSGEVTPSLETVLSTLGRIKADGFSSSKDLIDEAFIRSVMEQGYEYHVWTVDDAETAKRFWQWGARSITTNLPGAIRRQLGEPGPAAASGGAGR